MFSSIYFLFFTEIFFICFVLFLVMWAILFTTPYVQDRSLVFYSTAPTLYLSGLASFILLLSLLNPVFFEFPKIQGFKIFILILFCIILFFLWTALSYEHIAFEYILLLNLVVFASFLMLSAMDFLTFYMALEIQSLSLYVLVSSSRDSVLSAEAGIKYFVLGAFSTSFFLLGLSYIYIYLGTLDFLTLSLFFIAEKGSFFLKFSFVLLFTLFIFKLAIVPFHSWSPDVYQGAAPYTSAILMTLPKTVFFLFLVKLLFFFNGVFFSPLVFIILGLLSLIIGALFAIAQYKIRRLLAFSSIVNLGFIFLVLGSLGFYSLSMSLAYFYVYIYGLISFFCLYFSVRKVNYSGTAFLDSIADFGGLYQAYPLLAIAIAVNFFSFAGIPPLAGFFGKFFLLSSLAFSHFIFISLLFLMATLLTAVYYLYLIRQMFFVVFFQNYIITNFFLLVLGFFLSLINIFFIFFFDLWYFLLWF